MYRRKGNKKGLTSQQKAEVKSIMMKPVEKKYYDESFFDYGIGNTPVWFDLTAPAQGTGSDQCLGGSINLISLQYRFTFFLGDSTNYIRYLILQWFPDSNNDAPNWTQVFQSIGAPPPFLLTDIMSPYILGEGGTNNFRVLVDEQFYLDADNPMQLYKGFINKGFRKQIEMNSTTQTGTAHLYLMLLSDSTLAPNPIINGYTRIRFTDS